MGLMKLERTETCVYDMDFNKIHLGDEVSLFGMTGKVVFESGAYGIGFKECINWERIESEIKPITGCGNSPCFCYNDNFISFWELLWNFNCEENCCIVVRQERGVKMFEWNEISEKGLPPIGKPLAVTIKDNLQGKPNELRLPVYYEKDSMKGGYHWSWRYGDFAYDLLPEISEVLAWCELPHPFEKESTTGEGGC